MIERIVNYFAKRARIVLAFLVVAALMISSLAAFSNNICANTTENAIQETSQKSQPAPDNVTSGYKELGAVAENNADKVIAQEAPSEPPKATSKITPVLAESKPNAQLEKTIIDYLEIPQEYWDKTKYYYNYVDLNMDGADEIFVVVMGPYTSGTGGSTALHIIPNSTGMHVNQEFTLIQPPIIVSDKVTKGVKELVVKNSGGGASGNYIVLTCSDGQFTTVNEGTVIKGLEGVSGKAIISNNILKDMEEKKALYLQYN